MMAELAIQNYIERQSSPWLTLRRHMLRGLIRWVGFGLLGRVRVHGEENIPHTGPVLLMMNHITALDPGICMGASNDRFVIPMTKIENTYHPLGALAVWWWGAYTVNRGEFDRKALTNSIELLKSGQCILIAPEGTRQKNGLTHPKDGMTYVATKSEAVIVPAILSSGTIAWKERWKKLQKPDIDVYFGKPFRFKTEGRSRIPRDELSRMTEEAMYQMALTIPDSDQALRGVYSDVSKATARYLEFIDTRASN